MHSIRHLPLVLLAGVTLAAFSQTTIPPTRSKSPSSGNAAGLPPSRTPSTSVPLGTGIPRTAVPGAHTTTNRREPCWEVAGISKSAMQQRHVLAQQAKQEVEAVCANASLTPAQKQQHIREIHQQERQQMQGLITPQQEEALRACRQQRGGSFGGGHIGGHGAGPCGTFPGIVHRETESDFNEDPPEK